MTARRFIASMLPSQTTGAVKGAYKMRYVRAHTRVLHLAKIIITRNMRVRIATFRPQIIKA
jgi:hypothetical protein